MAVGGSAFRFGNRERALAERWDGASWVIVPIATKAGWRSSVLDGVSCTSATECMAVGTATTRAGRDRTLVERWRGGRWRIQRTPKLSRALPIHSLSAVSCTAADACVAVGEVGKERYNPSYRATYWGLIERWNGHRWRVARLIRFRGGITANLNAVSCWSASACVAVGDRNAQDSDHPLAWRWNGHRWRNLQPPAFVDLAGLLGVSCGSPTSCTAVGQYSIPRNEYALSERWDRGHWTASSPPLPEGTGGAELTGVSCLSPSSCIAVGRAGLVDPTGGLAEAWNGTDWAMQPTPGGDGWPLTQVTCRPLFCLAVGAHGRSTLAERFG